MKSDTPKMDPIIDLIWSVEDEEITPLDENSITANCGGGGGCISVACCSGVDIPNIFTKWICN